MEIMTELSEQDHSTRLTEYELTFLHRIAAAMLSPSLLRNSRQEVWDYYKLFWSVTRSEYYLTGRQMRALSFILRIAFKHIRELSQAGKTEECADLSEALSKLPLFISRNMDWEETIESLRAYEERYPETTFHYVQILERIRDKPTTC